MSHHCEAALITCEDFRLHQRKDGRNAIAEFIKTEGIDCDIITRGGAAKDLIFPKGEGLSAVLKFFLKKFFTRSILRDVGVSVSLHQANKVYLAHHEDCGAYGGKKAFAGDEAEKNKHRADMKKAGEIIKKKFPEIKIKLFYGELKPGTDDDFVIKEVN